MKIFIVAAGLLALTSTAMAADVGVSINVGEPGFYGQIDIGNFPRPQVIYAQPVLVERQVHYANPQPIYLRVPPGHEKHWDKHCYQYQACGRPVYFVRDNWYRNEYAPRYRERHDYSRHDDRHDYHDHHDHHDRDDESDDHGGHGHGKGHGGH